MPVQGEAGAQGPPEAATVPGWERETGDRLVATHPPSVAHGTLARGCSHLPASAADLLEQYGAREPCGTLLSAPQLPPARRVLGSLAAPVGLRGEQVQCHLGQPGETISKRPPALQHWVVGKGWGPRSVPRKGHTRELPRRGEGEVRRHMGKLGRQERGEEMREAGGWWRAACASRAQHSISTEGMSESRGK